MSIICDPLFHFDHQNIISWWKNQLQDKKIVRSSESINFLWIEGREGAVDHEFRPQIEQKYYEFSLKRSCLQIIPHQLILNYTKSIISLLGREMAPNVGRDGLKFEYLLNVDIYWFFLSIQRDTKNPNSAIDTLHFYKRLSFSSEFLVPGTDSWLSSLK